MPKVLNSSLFCYVQKTNADHAKSYGVRVFGSHSAYINVLISKDRGVKHPLLGKHKTPGENKAMRFKVGQTWGRSWGKQGNTLRVVKIDPKRKIVTLSSKWL